MEENPFQKLNIACRLAAISLADLGNTLKKLVGQQEEIEKHQELIAISDIPIPTGAAVKYLDESVNCEGCQKTFVNCKC